MFKKLFVTILLGVVSFGGSTFACLSMYPVNPDSIFVGTLKSFSQTGTTITANFQQSQVFYGPVYGTVGFGLIPTVPVVVSSDTSDSCGSYLLSSFVTGAQYVVYSNGAMGRRIIGPDTGTVQTEIATLNNKWINNTVVNNFTGKCMILNVFDSASFSGVQSVAFSPYGQNIAFLYQNQVGKRITKDKIQFYNADGLVNNNVIFSGNDIYYIRKLPSNLYYVFKNDQQTNLFVLGGISIRADRFSYVETIGMPAPNNNPQYLSLLQRSQVFMNNYNNISLTSYSSDYKNFSFIGNKSGLGTFINMNGLESQALDKVYGMMFDSTSTFLYTVVQKNNSVYHMSCNVKNSFTGSNVYPSVYEPVCGDTSNMGCNLNYPSTCDLGTGGKKTFSNIYELNQAGVPFLYSGVCKYNSSNQSELEKAISRMYDNGLTRYNNVTDFRANDSLRRDEASKFYSEFSKKYFNGVINTNKSCGFFDMNDVDPTLLSNVLESCQLGLFQGSNGKFIPRQHLTNGQALAVLIRMVDSWKNEGGLIKRYENYFTKAVELGLVGNLSIGSFSNGDKNTTRGDVAIAIYRAFLKR